MDVGEVEKLGNCTFIIFFIFFRPLLLILDDIDTCYMMVYSVEFGFSSRHMSRFACQRLQEARCGHILWVVGTYLFGQTIFIPYLYVP